MKLIMLPGMDGTGKLFHPFIKEIPGSIECVTVSYPEKECLGYKELETYVIEKLPANEDFVLLAESFSGPIGYLIAKRNLPNMKGMFFVASFLQSPKKLLVNLVRFIPLSLLLAFPVPQWVIRNFILDKNADNNCIRMFTDTIKNVSSKVLSFRIKEVSKLSLNIEKIEIKSYYIQALNDKFVSSDSVNSFAKISDSLKVIKIDGPHFIMQTRPKECAVFITNEIRLITSV